MASPLSGSCSPQQKNGSDSFGISPPLQLSDWTILLAAKGRAVFDPPNAQSQFGFRLGVTLGLQQQQQKIGKRSPQTRNAEERAHAYRGGRGQKTFLDQTQIVLINLHESARSSVGRHRSHRISNLSSLPVFDE